MQFYGEWDGRRIPSLKDQTKIFQWIDVITSDGNQLNSGGVDGAVTGDIGWMRRTDASLPAGFAFWTGLYRFW